LPEATAIVLVANATGLLTAVHFCEQETTDSLAALERYFLSEMN
jgi:hypothetical protein